MAMAVGMAMAEAHLESVFNREGYNVIDHYTFVLGGDGCLEEGINYEAFSTAGTLGLSKLIVLYDSNKISIEGNTDIAFTEDVTERMKAMGFQTLDVADGNDLEAIGKAIEEAKADKERPSFITVHTKIGYGSPKEGMASAHGEPLGEDNIISMKKNFWGAVLGVLLAVHLVLAVVAAVILVDAGLLHLLGVRYTSFGWLIGYVLLSSVIGLPLELFTNGLAGALFRLGWATRRQANLLYIPLDTLCSALVFWAADLLMPQVEANALAILVTGLLSALCSQPIEKARQRKRPGQDQESD